MVLLLLGCAALWVSAQHMPPLGANEAEQARLMAISASLRCLVCQGESLYASHTGLAQDLRREIRSMIEQGRSDEEIVDTLLARYGDLLRHDEAKTMDAFWWALAVLLLAAAAGLMLYLNRRHARSGFPARRY